MFHWCAVFVAVLDVGQDCTSDLLYAVAKTPSGPEVSVQGVFEGSAGSSAASGFTTQLRVKSGRALVTVEVRQGMLMLRLRLLSVRFWAVAVGAQACVVLLVCSCESASVRTLRRSCAVRTFRRWGCCLPAALTGLHAPGNTRRRSTTV